MTNGRLISPAEAANCNPITRRAVGFTPYSGGSVSAAGNVEETPRPVPTAAAHRTTRDSHIKKQSDDARHTAVFATSMGQAVETRPERTAHRIRPALIAIQKFDVMMAINSSGTLRGAAPHFSSEGWRGEGWRGSSARSLAVLDAVRREPGGNRVFDACASLFTRVSVGGVAAAARACAHQPRRCGAGVGGRGLVQEVRRGGRARALQSAGAESTASCPARRLRRSRQCRSSASSPSST